MGQGQKYISAEARKPEELDKLPVFFIVGRGRSGSTLLRSLLDAHPRVMIPLESRFVQFLYYKYPSNRRWTREEATRAIHDLELSFEPPDIQRESLGKELERYAGNLNFQRFCKLIYLHTHSAFPKEEILVIGDKNPRYTFFISQLLSLFPHAKFIHLVRDYRDNVVAVQRAGKLIRESGNIDVAMGRWSLYNHLVFKAHKKFPERFCRIHFEELVRDPEKVMKKLFAYLELDYIPEIMNYRKGLDPYFMEKGFTALHKSLQTPFDLSKIGEWEHVLSQSQAIRCEVLAGRFAERMGYLPRFDVNLLQRAGIFLLHYPILLIGNFRFVLKMLLYRWRPVMRMAYSILLKWT